MSSAATNARAGAATFALAVVVGATMLLTAPLLAVGAVLMMVPPAARPLLKRWVAAVVALLREGVMAVALAVLWVGSPLLGGAGSQRLVRAHTLLLGWFVRGVLRDRAVLLGAALVAETIPDDLVLDRRAAEDRRPVLVAARPGGDADPVVLAHVIVNTYRRRALSVPAAVVPAPTAGQVALGVTLGRLSRNSGDSAGGGQMDCTADGALLLISAQDGRGLADEIGLVTSAADMLFVAHRGWPGELRVAQWSAHHDEIPADSAAAPEARAQWLDDRLAAMDDWTTVDIA